MAQLDCGDDPLAIDAGELNIDIDAGTNIMSDTVAVQMGAGFQHEENKLLNGAFGAVGMDGGHRPGVASVDRAKESESLWSAQFAEDDPVRPHA